MKFSWFIVIFAVFLPVVLGGEYFSSNGIRYFFSPPMSKTWYQAQRFCHAYGMYLATVHSNEDNEILLDLILNKVRPAKNTDHFWTSGTDIGYPDKQFYWSESGHEVLFTNWISGYPNSSDRDCILLHADHKFKWYDQTCNNSHYFICQDKIFVPNAVKREIYLESVTEERTADSVKQIQSGGNLVQCTDGKFRDANGRCRRVRKAEGLTNLVRLLLSNQKGESKD